MLHKPFPQPCRLLRLGLISPDVFVCGAVANETPIRQQGQNDISIRSEEGASSLFDLIKEVSGVCETRFLSLNGESDMQIQQSRSAVRYSR